MAAVRVFKRFDEKSIRNWTLYVIRLNNDRYYIGITSRRDFMSRINQHGGRWGARVNQDSRVEEVIELQHLGKMSGFEATRIENDTMLEYRKRFGARKVRGGYDISKKTAVIPTYTPGSIQSFGFILTCLLLALVLLIIIAQ